MTWIAGVDGFKGKWCLVLLNSGNGEVKARIVLRFAELLDIPERPAVVCVDIPIGLPEITAKGGRNCEAEARKLLGSPRASSVFSALGRAPLREASREEADAANKARGGVGIGAQAWGLSTKLREADEVMTPEHQKLIYEVHPEICFWALNGMAPIVAPKRSTDGERFRIEALVSGGFPRDFVQQLPLGLRVGRDDFLDACAGAWTANRILKKQAERLPAHIDRDARGLDMAMWY